MGMTDRRIVISNNSFVEQEISNLPLQKVNKNGQIVNVYLARVDYETGRRRIIRGTKIGSDIRVDAEYFIAAYAEIEPLVRADIPKIRRINLIRNW